MSHEKGIYTIEIPITTTHLTFKLKKIKKTIKVDHSINNLNVTLIPSKKNLIKMVREREEIRLCVIYSDSYPNGINILEVKQLKEMNLFIEASNMPPVNLVIQHFAII